TLKRNESQWLAQRRRSETSLRKMGLYRIRLSTGASLHAGSKNQVQLWLVGQHGEAALGKRLWPARGKETEVKVEVPEYLGPLLFVKLRKRHLLQDDAWFCNWISVQGPGDGDEVRFPCYRWVEGDGVLSLPEGTGERGDFCLANVEAAENKRFSHLCRSGARRLDFEKQCGMKEAGGLNLFHTAGTERGSGGWRRHQKSSFCRMLEAKQLAGRGGEEMGAVGSGSSEMGKAKHVWGMNGEVNMQGGAGIAACPALMPSLRTPLLQLQLPSAGSPPPPLFLPTDPPMVWLLAKCWVRSSDFQLHELQSHLLRGHLMAEVIAVATMRCLPSIHPIFKLIIPHLRYTLEINVRARTGLVSDMGIFDQVVSTGGGGHVELLKRAGGFLTYSSFCPPNDLADRGLLGVKSSFYAQDALRLWEIIFRYVEGIVSLHYKTDVAVKDDPELQTWCREITEIGLQGGQDRGFPVSLQSRDQVCHFVTMCIFTCTGQHSSVHLGQLDWYAWVPNAPCTMRLPPPTTKDATLETVMATLPNFHQASLQMSMTWQLGRRQPIMVAVGQHEEEYFSGPEPKAVLKKFREELAALDKEIENRNAKLDMPYEYLRPSLVENSVAI
uniref:Arachidonate 15-lipoxygenase n=1 Tax=Chlorocebus sabaeus TaxID=60711 RepID=A0A0D9RKZ4_CHLSB